MPKNLDAVPRTVEPSRKVTVPAGVRVSGAPEGSGDVGAGTTEAVTLATGANRRIIGVYAVVQAALPVLGFAVALWLTKTPRAGTRRRFGSDRPDSRNA